MEDDLFWEGWKAMARGVPRNYCNGYLWLLGWNRAARELPGYRNWAHVSALED